MSVLGAAGTGKTIIAARRAAELATAGLRVVFVADQRYLHGSLLEQPALRHRNIIVGTPEEVVRKLCPDLPTIGPDYPLWAAFVEAAEGGEALVDAVIVDEAQSYDKDLLEALLGLCPKSCQMYADPYQRDSTGMWRPPGDPRTFWLTHNCRNALPIAKLVARLSGSLTPRDGAPGSPVLFLEAKHDRTDFRAQFAAAVDDLSGRSAPHRWRSSPALRTRLTSESCLVSSAFGSLAGLETTVSRCSLRVNSGAAKPPRYCSSLVRSTSARTMRRPRITTSP